MGFGGDWVKAAAEGFSAFTVPCQIEGNCYTGKRIMALGLPPVGGFHTGQVDLPIRGRLCRRAGTDKQVVI